MLLRPQNPAWRLRCGTDVPREGQQSFPASRVPTSLVCRECLRVWASTPLHTRPTVDHDPRKQGTQKQSRNSSRPSYTFAG